MIKKFSEIESVNNLGAILYDKNQGYLSDKDKMRACDNLGVASTPELDEWKSIMTNIVPAVAQAVENANGAAETANLASAQAEAAASSVIEKPNAIAIAPLWNVDSDYSIGDIVMYNGKQYRFTADHSGAWNSSHVTEYNVNSEMNNTLTRRYDNITDCNLMTKPGIYNVNMTYSNVPSDFYNNGSLVFIGTSQTRGVQILQRNGFPTDASQPNKHVTYGKVWFRVINGANDFSDWKHIVTEEITDPMETNISTNSTNIGYLQTRSLYTKNISGNVADFNNMKETGIYYLSSVGTYTNSPISVGSILVMFNTTGTRGNQIAFDFYTNRIYARRYDTQWRKWELVYGSPCNIKKDPNNENRWIITFGDYKMELRHTVNEDQDVDNYNLQNIYTLGGNVLCPSGTDFIGPIKLRGDNDFLGGVHGSETTNEIVVLGDGTKLTLNDSTDVDCNHITIYMKSTCRRESDKSNAFSRMIGIEISKNKISVKSVFTSLADGLQLQRVTNGGLFAVRNNILVSTSMNNYIATSAPTESIDNMSHKNIECIFNTIYGRVTIRNIQGSEEENYAGWYAVFTNENPMRTKSYFDVYNAVYEGVSYKEVNTGDQFFGAADYIFEPNVNQA